MLKPMPRRRPPFANSLTGLAEDMARTIRATPDERVRRLKLLAGAAAMVLIGWAAGVGAQTTPSESAPPPLPSAVQPDNAPPANTSTSNPVGNPVGNPAANFPALPLGHDGVREAQSQLTALGFDPGPADGEAGPATVAAAEQYNENRGGSGPVPIDAALLARLQQDGAPRLTPEQVAARSQPRAPAPASNPLTNAVQHLETNLRGLFNGGR